MDAAALRVQDEPSLRRCLRCCRQHCSWVPGRHSPRPQHKIACSTILAASCSTHWNGRELDAARGAAAPCRACACCPPLLGCWVVASRAQTRSGSLPSGRSCLQTPGRPRLKWLVLRLCQVQPVEPGSVAGEGLVNQADDHQHQAGGGVAAPGMGVPLLEPQRDRFAGLKGHLHTTGWGGCERGGAAHSRQQAGWTAHELACMLIMCMSLLAVAALGWSAILVSSRAALYCRPSSSPKPTTRPKACRGLCCCLGLLTGRVCWYGFWAASTDP